MLVSGALSAVRQQWALSQSLVHALRCVSSHGGYPVGVAVEGHGYAGVPQMVMNQFGVDTASQEQGGARVPEVV
jgi:hypothetical protein